MLQIFDDQSTIVQLLQLVYAKLTHSLIIFLPVNRYRIGENNYKGTGTHKEERVQFRAFHHSPDHSFEFRANPCLLRDKKVKSKFCWISRPVERMSVTLFVFTGEKEKIKAEGKWIYKITADVKYKKMRTGD